MEEIEPTLVTTGAHNNKDEDEDKHVEDVTPTITRADIQTLNIIPGISLEEETPGQPPAYDSLDDTKEFHRHSFDAPILCRSQQENATI